MPGQHRISPRWMEQAERWVVWAGLGGGCVSGTHGLLSGPISTVSLRFGGDPEYGVAHESSGSVIWSDGCAPQPSRTTPPRYGRHRGTFFLTRPRRRDAPPPIPPNTPHVSAWIRRSAADSQGLSAGTHIQSSRRLPVDTKKKLYFLLF